jgi:hypothetical protein
VPWQGSVRFAEQLGAELVLLDGYHRLTAALGRISELFTTFLRQQKGVSTCESTR